MSEEEVRLVVISGGLVTFGQVLDVWTEYEFTEDVFTPNTFHFRLALTGGDSPAPEEYIRRLCAVAKEDSVVRLEVGRNNTPLGMGIIDEQFIDGDRTQEFIQITGRDPASLLQDNEVSTKLRVGTGITLPALAEECMRRYRGHGIPYGIETSNDANRDVLTGKIRTAPAKFVRTTRGAAPVTRPRTGDIPVNFTSQKIEDARPHPGETEWDFLSRHAKNLGVLLWFSARGNLVISQPDYNQPIRFHLHRNLDDPDQENTILSGGRRRTVAGTATAIHLLGHGALSRAKKRKVKVKVQTTVRSDRVTVFPREKFFKDAHVQSTAEAVRAARHEMAHLNANAEVYEYKAQGHSYADGSYWTVDTMGHVRDELPRPAADLDVYTTRRVATKNKTTTQTTLTLTPIGAIAL